MVFERNEEINGLITLKVGISGINHDVVSVRGDLGIIEESKNMLF